MSIYRRTDRVPLNDVAFSAEPGTPVATSAGAGVVQSQNDEDWSRKRSAEPVNGLLRPTINWASGLPPQVLPKALLAKFPELRDGFNAIIARATEPSGKDYGTLLAVKDVP